MAVGRWLHAAILAGSLAGLVTAVTPASADTAWDQTQATRLAAQLEDAAKRFEDELRKQPPATASSGQPESAERLRDQAQRLENTATSLAAHLDEGEGRAETEPLFKKVTEVASETAESARNQMVPKPVMKDWDAVTGALEDLAAYYGSDEQDAAEMPAEALDPQKE